MPTIFDIAKMAGVSKTTVSKVLNNQSGVNSETKKRILEAIKALDYSPNQAARSLVTSRTGVIGVIFDSFNMPIYIEMANQLEAFAHQFSYHLSFSNCNNDHDTKSKYVNYFTSGAADGIIIFGSDIRDRKLIERLKEARFPFVVIENHFDDLDVNNIIVDNVDAAYQAVKHLLKLGHRKIAHISGNVEHKAALDRIAGYRKALQEYEIPELIIQTDANQKDGIKAAQQFLALDEKPTAIFAFNDVLAYEAINVLTNEGFHVPNDLSVVGFDNISNVVDFIPCSISLTSIIQPINEVAESALQILSQNILNKDKSPRCITFKTSLFEGKSCKPLT